MALLPAMIWLQSLFYKVLCRRNIRVPEDIQLIGYDNIALAHLMTPELTTVGQPIKKMGIKAVNMLLQKETQSYKEYIFSPELIVRETTKEMKGADHQ